jgi:hypothetical protein
VLIGHRESGRLWLGPLDLLGPVCPLGSELRALRIGYCAVDNHAINTKYTGYDGH